MENTEKRTVKLTAKALACKMETLQKQRQSNVTKMKELSREIKGLMKNDENAKKVQFKLNELKQLCENANAAHESVIVLLPKEEKVTQNEWYGRIIKHNTDFTDDVKTWLSETERHFQQARNVTADVFAAQSVISPIPPEDEAPVAPVELKEDIPHSDVPPAIPSQQNKTISDMQDEIEPSDSVSNIANRSHKSHSSCSRFSTTSSACIKAEAEMAALIVKQQMLKDKHAIEAQEEQLKDEEEQLRKEEQLRRKKEQLELDGNLAATMAKMKILGASSRSGVRSHRSRVSDGMNSYMEKKLCEKKTQMIATAGGDITQTQSLPTMPVTVQSNTLTMDAAHVTIPTTLPAPSNGEQSNMLNIMEKQNDITALMVQQQSLSLMPKKEIRRFDGDPLQFQTFIKSFEHNIESKNPNPTDCLYYLEQYTEAQPREMVRSCLHMTADRGFRKAKSLLQEHFGNEHKIATAYMEKALSWSSIKPDDTKTLQAYTLFLRGCCNAMEDVNNMQELNMSANLLIIIKKLPYRLRDKWRSVACDFQERYKQRATFRDLVNYLEKQVRIATDPVFGDIRDTPTPSKDGRSFMSKPPHPRIKGRNIPHQNDINQWHHLKNIHLPELDCEIELLIGSDGGFVLTKWISNSRHVLAAIPETERAKEMKDLDLDHDKLPVERMLGVQWCVQSDVFKFKIILKDRPLTRRGILSTVSSVYDPLGMLAPVVLTAKRILQELCREKTGWDDVIPDSIVQEWMSWIQELHNLEDFKVNRCFKPTNFRAVTSAQLHHFADACQDGYGTVSYLLLHDNHGQTHCAFVMGKARVAPLKPVTIPRMELTAATMVSRMDTILRKELQMELAESTFWTDSTSVLKTGPHVANRVTEIAKASDEHQWRYVNTNDNPADMASRGLKVKAFLKKEMWVYGPPFLLGPQEEWPQNPDGLDAISPKDSEVKSITVNAAQIRPKVVDPTTNFIHYFSS
ncbi:hypothetical protein N1851_015620 [Merluccius polli]|uniref:Uncharacterized protein n=1 Tax=Merluccius polli TaxID=89951 RepID=A0AA47MRW8_MERPO|nr:hypothetical protein N1851_015620 [Merluccius polli]